MFLPDIEATWGVAKHPPKVGLDKPASRRLSEMPRPEKTELVQLKIEPLNFEPAHGQLLFAGTGSQ